MTPSTARACCPTWATSPASCRATTHRRSSSTTPCAGRPRRSRSRPWPATSGRGSSGCHRRATNGLAGEPAGAFATNAFDCVNLIALASAQADSDDPEAIAALISGISVGGVSCREYAICLELVADGRNVDYDGPGGRVEIGTDGDPVSYRFERWRFDEQGVDRRVEEPDLPTS